MKIHSLYKKKRTKTRKEGVGTKILQCGGGHHAVDQINKSSSKNKLAG